MDEKKLDLTGNPVDVWAQLIGRTGYVFSPEDLKNIAEARAICEERVTYEERMAEARYVAYRFRATGSPDDFEAMLAQAGFTPQTDA